MNLHLQKSLDGGELFQIVTQNFRAPQDFWTYFNLENAVMGIAIFNVAFSFFLMFLILKVSIVNLYSSLRCIIDIEEECSIDPEARLLIVEGLFLYGPYVLIDPILYRGVNDEDYYQVDLWWRMASALTVIRGLTSLFTGNIGWILWDVIQLRIVHEYKETVMFKGKWGMPHGFATGQWSKENSY
ncbi:uncharacterized protein LOC118434396 [Folsomia candida]|uniref:uncharacterized protein LOC118434396 n=1 Tax=Folsomia candida TaxID=158441 RepID=UPI001604ED70|nr:uncharacterized protein LOC118434396 [Folsomia candida]